MPESRLERAVLLTILSIFTLLGGLYSINVPIFEASDELWHYPMMEHIATHWTLPVQPLEPGTSSGPWRQEASQPPLYYGIGAALTAWIDTTDLERVRHLNPHAAAGEITADQSNPNLIAHNPALEKFPWRGTVLAVHIARFYSVLLGTWAVYLTWALVRELFPDTPWIALTSAAVHAFTPMYLFISSSVNNDNLIVPLCSLALLLMVRLIKKAPLEKDLRKDSYAHLLLGAVIGLGLLTKASAIGLLPFIGATLFWEAWRLPKENSVLQRSGYFFSRLGLVLLPALALSAWWFYRNYQLYGDWLGFNAFYAVLGTRDVPASLAQLWAERFAFAAGYWGNFGGLNVPMASGIYTLLNLVAIVALGGVSVGFLTWLLRLPQKATSGVTIGARLLQAPAKLWPFNWDELTAARALAWAWPAAIFISWTRWATVTWSSQGRLIFSAIGMWSLALVLGVTIWIPKRAAAYRRTLAMNLAAFLLGICLIALPVWIVPMYTPPPQDTVTQSAQPLDLRFGDTLRLRGYTLENSTLHPGEEVAWTLVWEALAPTPSDHSIFVHLLGNGDRIIAQRDTFPARGLLSTTWLEPGRVWTERYVTEIPPMAYAPDDLTLSIGLYETATGIRQAVVNSDGETIGETTRFGALHLAPQTGNLPNPVEIYFGEGIVLEGYDLSSVTARPGEQITVDLHWRCAKPIDNDYTISVQLIDPQWNKAAQAPDSWPLDGAAPTSAWQTEQQIAEARYLDITPDAAPGSYDLQITLYRVDENGGLEHLPIIWEQGQMPAKNLRLTRIYVE